MAFILAGVPPIYGLYSCTVPLLLYGVMGTSGQVALGPVAMISLLTSGAISALPGVTPGITVALVHLLALLYGVSSLLLGLLGLGSVTQFLSHEVLGGFTAAAAVIISFSQMKYVLGVSVGRHHYPAETIVEVLSKIPQTNFAELCIALLSMCIILSLRRWKKKHVDDGKDNGERSTRGYKVMAIIVRFSALVVVIVASTIAAIMVSAGVDVNIVGRQPTGIPAPTIVLSSSTIISYVPDLVLPAVTMAFIGFAETYAVGKVYDNEGLLEPNQELVAIGIANIVGAFFNSIPVAGSFGRTAVNASAGSKSSMSNVLTGLGVIMILLLLSPIITFVPYSALAAIIITSVTKLINIDAFKLAWKVSRADFSVLVTTLVATLSLGIEIGIAVGTVFSILNIIRESASPHIAILGRANVAKEEGEEEKLQWRDIERFPEAYRPPRNIVLRMDRSLFFPNCECFEDFVLGTVNAKENKDVVNVVVDLVAVNKIDLSGLHVLSGLQDKLKEGDIRLTFACAKGEVRDTLKRWASASSHGAFLHFDSIEDALVEDHSVKEAGDDIKEGDDIEEGDIEEGKSATSVKSVLLEEDGLGEQAIDTEPGKQSAANVEEEKTVGDDATKAV